MLRILGNSTLLRLSENRVQFVRTVVDRFFEKLSKNVANKIR